MIFHIMILAFGILVDVTLQFSFFGIMVSPGVATLFLLYLGFRRPFKEVFSVLIAFVVLSHPFTGLNVFVILMAFWMVLLIIYRLRSKMFAEAYLTYALWVLVFSPALQIFLGFESYGIKSLPALAGRLTEVGLKSFVMALLTVPLFILWDFVYDLGTGREGIG